MSDNQANPTKGAETDLQKAAKSISGLLTPLNPKEEEEIGKGEAPIAKKLQKELMLFTTNQKDEEERHIQTNALTKTMEFFKSRL